MGTVRLCILCLFMVLLMIRSQQDCQYFREQYEISKSLDIIQRLAVCEANNKHFDIAGELFIEATTLSNKAELYYNAARAYQESGNFIKSKEYYSKCLELSNNAARVCHIKIASLYRDLDEFNLVQSHLHYAIQLDPNNFDAYSYLGDTYNNLKQFSEAVKMYDKAISLSSQNPKLWISLADSYSNLKKSKDALHCYNVAYSLIIQHEGVQITLDGITALLGKHFASLDLGYWENFENDSENIKKSIRYSIEMYDRGLAPPSPLSPYRSFFMDFDDDRLAVDISRSWGNELVKSAALSSNVYSDDSKYDKNKSEALLIKNENCKMTIGYISRRFEDYPGTQMMLRIFEYHNRTIPINQKGAVCIAAIATGVDDGSVERIIIKSTCDYFIDISKMTTSESYLLLRSLAIDVLIDYDGFHDYNNVKLLAQRPARIQATWLGYAGSTGFGRNTATKSAQQPIEYLIGDRYIVPPDLKFSQFYNENIVYLPYTYQPQDERQGLLLNEIVKHEKESIPVITDRKRIYSNEQKILYRKNLIEQYSHNYNFTDPLINIDSLSKKFWLVNLTRQAKIVPSNFIDWLHLLVEFKNSILVLMAENANVISALQLQAAYHGISPSRLLFFNRLPRADYRSVLHVSDLFLDTNYYGAHTVASDSMFGSTPVLSLTGNSFSSRVGTSLNNAAHVDNELNANTRKDFFNLGSKLIDTKYKTINNNDFNLILCHIKNKIRNSKNLFNSKIFAKYLENAYKAMDSISHSSSSHNRHIIVTE